MLVVDEYLAVRVLVGEWPDRLPDEPVAITASAHWRLLQRVHNPGGGQLSVLLGQLAPLDLAILRFPHPEVLSVIDPRPLLDDAARLAAAYGNTGLHVAETATAGRVNGRQLWFGNAQNIGLRLREIAADLDITINVA